MSERKLSTYYAEPEGRGHCDVCIDLKEELPYIKYYDDNGKQFFSEDFPNKSLRYVEDAAENWALGIKKLD